MPYPVSMPYRNVVAALVLLGAICAGIVDNHCDLPRVTMSQVEAVMATQQSTTDDACSSVCVPDCFSCSRSEGPGFTLLTFGPQSAIVAFVRSDPRPSDGTPSLPYRPPLQLL